MLAATGSSGRRWWPDHRRVLRRRRSLSSHRCPRPRARHRPVQCSGWRRWPLVRWSRDDASASSVTGGIALADHSVVPASSMIGHPPARHRRRGHEMPHAALLRTLVDGWRRTALTTVCLRGVRPGSDLVPTRRELLKGWWWRWRSSAWRGRPPASTAAGAATGAAEPGSSGAAGQGTPTVPGFRRGGAGPLYWSTYDYEKS